MEVSEAATKLLEVTRLRLVAADAMHEAMLLDGTCAHLREQSAAFLRRAKDDHEWAKGIVATEVRVAAQAKQWLDGVR